MGDFFKFLWSSQNIWTLQHCVFTWYFMHFHSFLQEKTWENILWNQKVHCTKNGMRLQHFLTVLCGLLLYAGNNETGHFFYWDPKFFKDLLGKFLECHLTFKPKISHGQLCHLTSYLLHFVKTCFFEVCHHLNLKWTYLNKIEYLVTVLFEMQI